MRLELSDVAVSIDTTPIVHDCTLRIEPGELVALVGPNGSGKSTLLRTVYRSVTPTVGAVLLDGDDATRLRQRELARRAAVVAQENPAEFEFRAHQIVMMGRTPHHGPFDADTARDRALVHDALDTVGALPLRDRVFTTLSGGEKQRVLVARALAQQTPLLLLDEPTNHLDVHAALDLLDLVRRLRLTTLCVLHDLNLAAAYSDRIAVLHRGTIVATGTPAAVLDAALIRSVFGVRAHVLRHPVTGRPLLAFSGRDAGNGEPDDGAG